MHTRCIKISVTDYDDPFIYIYKISHHNDTTICRKANIWYIPHNMYLIFRVNIYAAEYHNTTEITSYITIMS